MKTWLIKNDGLGHDTTRNRIDEFNHLSRWTGDEWTSSIREKFATRYVSEVPSEEQDIDPEAWAEIQGKPWTVSWDDSEESPMDTTEVARFATEAEADAFASSENIRLQNEFIHNDTNFCILHLPDDIDPFITGVEHGKYPLSRKCECSLTRDGTTVEAHATWNAQGVTDTWANCQAILETLVNLISDLIENTLTDAEVEDKPDPGDPSLGSLTAADFHGNQTTFAPGMHIMYQTKDGQLFPGTVKSILLGRLEITWPNEAKSWITPATCYPG